MLTGYYIRDGKVETFEHVDRMIVPEPVKTDLAAALHLDCEVIETKESRRRGWKIRRRNEIRCSLIRASECIAAILMLLMAMLPAGDGFDFRKLPVLILAIAIPGVWIGLVEYANSGARKKGTSAATE